MKTNLLFLLVFMLLMGCGPRVHFVSVGEKQYPPKPMDYELIVFFKGDRPERDYEVIGIVYAETEHAQSVVQKTRDTKVLEGLKKVARQYGADAIIDVTISLGNKPSGNLFEDDLIKHAEGKAIVFK